jgi:hypothetical protein
MSATKKKIWDTDMQFALYLAPEAFVTLRVAKKRSLFFAERDYSRVCHGMLGQRVIDEVHTIVVPGRSSESLKCFLHDEWRRDPSFRTRIVQEGANFWLERWYNLYSRRTLWRRSRV